ncbi:group II intron reverse transcriptase domain-containing protein, partial [Candidatus Woesearchaeota archaeon]|nr:group II intron reverse transcriptase domain-containing protein [Candidatus Woesearchaeota archaeon]
MNDHNYSYQRLCSYENLELAYKKARRRKTKKFYVLEFEQNLTENLLKLRTELLLHSYRPKPLKTFVVRDPKTRKISKSDFRDRVVHHAIINIIEPIYEQVFIQDSYANRKNKGTLAATDRFDKFKRKVTSNFKNKAYCLKADIKHYFDNVDHKVLISIIRRKIKDDKIVWLIWQILENFDSKLKDKGMPLGNLTSQFFANVYLNELDQFVKHKLKAKYYLRYVDDFVILHENLEVLEQYKTEINQFLNTPLNLELHKTKTRIKSLIRGVTFLGFRIFYHYKLLRKSNKRKMNKKLLLLKEQFDKKLINSDKVYEIIFGWISYAKHANTYKLRKN